MVELTHDGRLLQQMDLVFLARRALNQLLHGDVVLGGIVSPRALAHNGERTLTNLLLDA